jgi:hypothetical protein
MWRVWGVLWGVCVHAIISYVYVGGGGGVVSMGGIVRSLVVVDLCKKTVLSLSFPYVCPEPVLVK